MKKDKYDVVIVDDENQCISNLCKSFQTADRFEVIGTESKPEIGKKLIMNIRPDLLFIDVEMPGTTGLELIRSIKEEVDWNMQVVFYTAYDKYLLEALRTSAFDYLLKPYTEEELQTVLARFIEYEENNKQKYSFNNKVNNLYVGNNNRLLLTTVRGYQMIDIKDVGYFEYNTLKRLWTVILKDKTINIKRGTSSNNILKLTDKFLQVNQHEIINIDYLDAIEGKTCTLLSPFEKKNITISRKYLENVEDHFYML